MALLHTYIVNWAKLWGLNDGPVQYENKLENTRFRLQNKRKRLEGNIYENKLENTGFRLQSKRKWVEDNILDGGLLCRTANIAIFRQLRKCV